LVEAFPYFHISDAERGLVKAE